MNQMSVEMYVDLAGHGGCDQSGSVFLQPLDGGFDLGNHLVDLPSFLVEVVGDGALLRKWRERNFHPTYD